MISTAPSQIFCSRCGFLNDGDNNTCVQCDLQLRSTLDKISTDLRDSTNLLARDMGMNMNIKCPGCHLICFVPPATAGLRCGTCHTYFASPTVGEMTNFHMTRLASSIRGFFRRSSDTIEEVPEGKLIAIGELAPRRISTENCQLESSASFELHEEDEAEEKAAVTEDMEEHKAESNTSIIGVREVPRLEAPVSPQKPTRTFAQPHAMAIPVNVPSTPYQKSHNPSVPTALAASHLDNIYEVEGDIVEL